MWSDGRTSARRLESCSTESFDWGTPMTLMAGDVGSPEAVDAPPVAAPPPPPKPSTADVERDGFTRGYAAGERAGAEAAATRGEAMLRRLSATLQELETLRVEMIRKTERQLVELSVAIASRIIHREISLDRELLVAMARVAMDRLGGCSAATVRLNPEDFAAVGAARAAADDSVRFVADPHVTRGGCIVESDFGVVDASVDTQLDEIAAALLPAGTPRSLPAPLASLDDVA